jgi:hypothetical protein
MPNLFEQFLNKVNRKYGQVDKNVFGGLLPGGAATPIGAAFQNEKVSTFGLEPYPMERRASSLVDAGAGAIAKAQPFVEKSIKTLPNPIQSGISSSLNALPFSVNLFARYYTGLGNKNLNIPDSATVGIKDYLQKQQQLLPKKVEELSSKLLRDSSILKKAKAGEIDESEMYKTAHSIKFLNDVVATQKSDLQKAKQGTLHFSGYDAMDRNPLTSPGTSFGQVWFQPNKDGFVAKEKYDFMYGNADAKVPMGPSIEEMQGKVRLTPSQRYASEIYNPMSTDGSSVLMSPLTNIGRAIVAKLPDKSFDYPIVIR